MKPKTKLNAIKGVFLLFFFVMTSCYIYKPYSGIEVATSNARGGISNSKVSGLRDTDKLNRDKKPAQSAAVSGNLQRVEKNEKPDNAELPSDYDDKQKEIEMQKRQEIEKMKDLDPRKKAEMDAEMEAADKRAKAESEGKAVSDESLVKKTPTKGNEIEMGILKSKIKPNKYYKITVEEKTYKIQADQWEGDTLVSHILRKPKKVLRFHENQINEEILLERRFSKPYSDIFTVGSYVVGGAAILLLVL